MIRQSTATKSITTSSTEKIPVILTGHALQSLRDSGYSLAAALGEVIDNSLEANANNIILHLEESQTKSGKKHIHRIAIIDDGDGMKLDILQRYLQIGFSTRYMRTDTIGKYGVGAKLAALNYGQRIDVWSRTNEDESWNHVYFDLEEALEQEKHGESVSIASPNIEVVPENLVSLLPEYSGTVVVWSKVDRLEDGRQAPDARALEAGIKHELSRMFRYFLNDGICISINATELLPHDPLFLMQGTWADSVLFEYYDRLRKAAVKKGTEPPLPLPDTSQKHFPATRITIQEPIKIGSSSCFLTVTLYPKQLLRKRLMGGDKLAEQLRLLDNLGSISFVRLNREINYTSVPRIFPRGVQDPDRFIGIEVSFTPELDSYFGVRNVKRGVEPYDELRTKIRELLKKYIGEARASLEEVWGAVSRETNENQGEHQPILEAAKKANLTLPKSRVKTQIDEQEKERILVDLAKDVVGKDEEKQQEYRETIKDFPFVVQSVDFPGDLFMDIQHIDGQVIIRLNTRHRFYREMWEPLRSIADAPLGSVSEDEAKKAAQRSIEALTLLIIAYGKAESMDNNPRESYSELRSYWGKFADSLMGKVKNVI